MGKYAINITIAGRSYRLKVDEIEEEVVRNAAILINEKVNELSENYAFKDKQDLLAMSNIMFSSELIKLKKTTENSAIIEFEKLQKIDEILSN